jgi:hypothetical protein
VRQSASWTAAYHRQLTVAAGPDPSIAAGVPSVSLQVSGPGGCSPRQRLPGGASSRSRGVGRCRRGRPCQQPRHGVGRRCPAGGVHPSGFGVRDPAVRPSGVRSPGVVVHRVRPLGRPLSTRPVSSCPVSTRAVSSRLLSALVGPDASVSPLRRWRWGPGRGGRATLTTRTGEGPGGCRAVDGSINGRGGRDASDAAHLALDEWEVGSRPGPPGWVLAAAAALAR